MMSISRLICLIFLLFSIIYSSSWYILDPSSYLHTLCTVYTVYCVLYDELKGIIDLACQFVNYKTVYLQNLSGILELIMFL